MNASVVTDRPVVLTTSSNSRPHRSELRFLAAFTVLLLIIVASRLVRLNTFELDPDEVWSVWQTLGSPADIVKWTPFDWSPLYYLILGFWKGLTGIHPFTLRILSLFAFMVSMSLLYRVTRRLYGSTAGIIAVAACAAFGFAIHVSLVLRAYSFLFCMVILAWWLMLRYFNRPTIKRGLLLGVCLSIMFYLHVSSIAAYLLLGLYSIIVYRRKILKWWLPVATLVILSIPEIISKVGAASIRASTNTTSMGLWLVDGAAILWQLMRDLVVDLAGYNFPLWAAFMVIAAVVIADRYRFNRQVLALLVWVLAPLYLFVMGYVDTYTTRHLAWLIFGFAIWIGAGFKFLPRAAILGVLAVFVVLMFGSAPFERYKRILAPMVPTFHWLSDKVKGGDIIVVDPEIKQVALEEWDYYTRAYFPNGLDYVSDPADERRVWYVYIDGAHNKELFQRVERNRIATAEFGVEKFLVRLYEAPPDVSGIRFENGMRFHGVDALNTAAPSPVWHEGETIRLRLWWSTEQPIDVDLSVGTYVVDQSGTLAEFNGPPQLINGPKETSRWQPGRYYIEEREIVLAYPMKMADYNILLALYQWWDSKRIITENHPDGLILIMQFHVMSWSSRH